MNFPKLYIGPMSKNIVDATIDLARQGWKVCLIPSRRQIEYNKGYVNDWTTSDFVRYVRDRTDKVLIQRDHAGPKQGRTDDNGLESLSDDCANRLELIHLDPWKKYPDLDDAAKATKAMIDYCCHDDNESLFEVGTEEGIRKYSDLELNEFLKKLKKSLDRERFNRIKFAVIQSGVDLLGVTNTGTFNEERCSNMISVCKDYNLLSKEHNGDYLDGDLIKRRFELGLDGINIAPELGVEETKLILKEIKEQEREDLFEQLFKACFLSRFWVKWLPDGFFPKEPHEKRLLVEVCGHYIFNTNTIKELKKEVNIENDSLKAHLIKKIQELHGHYQ